MKTVEAKHTAGPWRAKVWEYPDAIPPRRELIIENGKFVVAHCAWDEGKDNPYTIHTSEAEANARLIAAAPELLEALKDCVEKIENSVGWNAVDIFPEDIYSLISKAEGGAE